MRVLAPSTFETKRAPAQYAAELHGKLQLKLVDAVT